MFEDICNSYPDNIGAVGNFAKKLRAGLSKGLIWKVGLFSIISKKKKKVLICMENMDIEFNLNWGLQIVSRQI